MINTEITQLLNIEYPIFQGAMAWISDAELAAAVSNSGGLGIIAGGNAPADWLREQIQKAKKLTDKPFGVNLMLLNPFIEEVSDVVIEEKVEIVITGAGNPGKYIDKWKAAGIKIIPVVASVSSAKRVAKHGVEAVIAEGGEAGGHVGVLNTMALVPQIVDAVDIPVIAAGGIADGRGALAAFSLGAKGIQLGTRFLVAKECNVHQNYKEKILKAGDISTMVTGTSTGHPVRVIKNQFAKTYKKMEDSGVEVEELEKYGAGSLHKSAVLGDIKGGSIMSGQIAGMVNKEETCKEIIDSIIKETKQYAEQLKQLFD